MNRIHMELVQTIYDYGEYYWMIDGRPIVRYLNEAVSAGACPRLEVFGSLEGLLPAWTGELVWKAENRFIWEMVESAEDLNVPVLVCEDDCDLSCIVIMAKIRKEPDTVYWDSLGVLNLENQDFRMEKQSGILCLEAYSDQDWEEYGDNIACEQFDSPEYRKWMSEHWDEELIRRRRNYTKPYMQREENITWICSPLWQFERKEYERMVEDYRKVYEDRWGWGQESVKFPYIKNPLRFRVYR